VKVFQYVIIFNPKPKENKETTEKAKILVDVTTVVATNEKHAGILASRAIPEEYLDRIADGEVEVVVRPF
jgi:hypothetical protein